MQNIELCCVESIIQFTGTYALLVPLINIAFASLWPQRSGGKYQKPWPANFAAAETDIALLTASVIVRY